MRKRLLKRLERKLGLCENEARDVLDTIQHNLLPMERLEDAVRIHISSVLRRAQEDMRRSGVVHSGMRRFTALRVSPIADSPPCGELMYDVPCNGSDIRRRWREIHETMMLD